MMTGVIMQILGNSIHLRLKILCGKEGDRLKDFF